MASSGRRRRVAVATLLVVALVALVVSLAAPGECRRQGKKKKRNGRSSVSRALRSKRRSCEKKACARVGDDDPNCVPACVNRPCFDQVYGKMPLEPGEIDSRRADEFDSCVRALKAEDLLQA